MSDEERDDLEQWCSVYGYDWPRHHVCAVGICYNPYRDGQASAVSRGVPPRKALAALRAELYR